MKTIHLILGILCAMFVVLDIQWDASPWVTALAVVSSIINFVVYFFMKW